MSQGQAGAEQRLVTPGMAIGPSAGKRAGSGIIAAGESFVATQLGWLRERNNTVSVDPINAAYMPRSGDLVVGIVAEVRNNLWFMNINGSFQGLLPMSLAPWKVEFGAARQHMDVGDVVLARVQEVDETHSAVATMKGMGLRKLKSGLLEEIPPHIIPQVIGKGGSMLQTLKDLGDSRLVIGQNGRVWIDGDHDGMRNVRAALKLIRENAHLPGLKERVDALANE